MIVCSRSAVIRWTTAGLIIGLATLGGYRLQASSGVSPGHVRLATGSFPQTWLSGTRGNDVNTATGCQIAAPCLTLSTAIANTAPGGEVTQSDPGAVSGGLPIGQAITINGLGSRMSVVAPGTDDFAVNAGPNDVVILRHLDLQGNGIGDAGVRFDSGKQLILDDVTISGFFKGVVTAPSLSGATITIINSHIAGNATGVSVSTSTGTVHVDISHSTIENNTFGIINGDGAVLDLSHSVISGNTSIGLGAETYGNLPSLVQADHDQFENNPYAVWEFHGAGNAQITIWLSDDDLVHNTTGIYGNFGGTLAVFSFGNNRLVNNATPGGVNGVAMQT